MVKKIFRNLLLGVIFVTLFQQEIALSEEFEISLPRLVLNHYTAQGDMYHWDKHNLQFLYDLLLLDNTAFSNRYLALKNYDSRPRKNADGYFRDAFFGPSGWSTKSNLFYRALYESGVLEELKAAATYDQQEAASSTTTILSRSNFTKLKSLVREVAALYRKNPILREKAYKRLRI